MILLLGLKSMDNMEDFNSKYTGAEVENLLDQVASGNVGGGVTEESDPIFSASPSAGITEENISSWNNKVDKVEGKQLSTEDFTTALKQRLEGLSNYDDSEISEAVNQLREDFDALVSGDSTTAIKTFNEIIAFLSGIEDSENLDSIIASIEQQIAGKMDNVTLSAVATSGSYSDLSDKPTIPAEQVNADWNATSGKAQILNKPTIPAAVTESTVSGWGFTKNTGTYSKPSAGIPKTDLATAVQTSLGKADTALQSEQYKGTVTSVKINGTTKTPDADGVVDLGTIEGGGSSSGSGEREIVEFVSEIEQLYPNKTYFSTAAEGGIYISGIVVDDTKLVEEYHIIANTVLSVEGMGFPDDADIEWVNDTIPDLGFSGEHWNADEMYVEMSITKVKHYDGNNKFLVVLAPFKRRSA